MSWLGFVPVHSRIYRVYCSIVRAKAHPVETVKSEINDFSLSLEKVVFKRKKKSDGLISV